MPRYNRPATELICHELFFKLCETRDAIILPYSRGLPQYEFSEIVLLPDGRSFVRDQEGPIFIDECFIEDNIAFWLEKEKRWEVVIWNKP